jgi:hypothetical protein
MRGNLQQRIKKLEQNKSHQVHLELPLFTVLSKDRKALLLDAATLKQLGIKQPELQPERFTALEEGYQVSLLDKLVNHTQAQDGTCLEVYFNKAQGQPVYAVEV